LVSDFWGNRTLLVTPSAIYATYQLGGPSEVRGFSHKGKRLPWSVPQEVAGVAGLTRDGEHGVLVRTQSYLTPARWYRHDERQGGAQLTTVISRSPSKDKQHRVIRELAVSADGTRVPMNIILPEGVEPRDLGKGTAGRLGRIDPLGKTAPHEHARLRLDPRRYAERFQPGDCVSRGARETTTQRFHMLAIAGVFQKHGNQFGR